MFNAIISDKTYGKFSIELSNWGEAANPNKSAKYESERGKCDCIVTKTNLRARQRVLKAISGRTERMDNYRNLGPVLCQ